MLAQEDSRSAFFTKPAAHCTYHLSLVDFGRIAFVSGCHMFPTPIGLYCWLQVHL